MAGGGVAVALFGALIIAEQGSASPAAPVSTKSIASLRPSIATPRINIPALPQRSPLATQQAPVPTQDLSAQQHLFPGNEQTCDALFQTREALLEQPDTPARSAALALNSFWLAVFHCEQISGDF